MLDCDPGMDDALAILLLLGSPEIVKVKAIVSTFGNVGLNQTKENLLRVLGFFHRIPLIGAGSSCPLKCAAQKARDVHGEDGLGDISYIFKKRHRVNFRNGIALIIDLALSNKIDKIVATGPPTDLAAAIKRNPAFLKGLDELVIMGGAVFAKGNVTPYAEFNFHCDPEAARIVLKAPVKKRLISLDVTHKALLTARHLRPLRDMKSPLAEFISRIASSSIRSNKRRGFNGAPMHDPLAAALAIDEGIGEYENLHLDVETRGRIRGKVVAKRGKPNVIFCKKVDTERFFGMFINAIIKLAKGVDEG